jgi:predicted unusual protein kinase regulating ubiquinone biosynthesis (AarF/ABC1/UbiB family)
MTRLLRTLDLVIGTRVKWATQPKKRHKIALETRQKVTKLGPTFVKIGQYVSTRDDIFPDEIIQEFTNLQDNVLTMEWPVVEDIIQKEDVPALDNVSHLPIASASLGQVHMATYEDKECVVKVLRPNVVKQIEDDVRNLAIISDVFKIFNPTGADDIMMFVKELEAMLKMETDYVREAENTKLFRKNFEDTDWVIVPKVYHASSNLLVMEYVPSTKITEVKGINKKSLAWALTKSQIIQILNSGFFHGDPHPGNVGVKDGKLVYYDFGMVSEISIKQKNTLMALLIAITSENEDQILAILNNLGLVASDPTGLRKFVRFFLDYIRKNDIQDPEQVQELIAVQNNPIKFSGSFFYLVRSFALIEGISKQLDPDYSSSSMLRKYVSETDVMEDAVMTSIRNTFSDISGVSYRLSSIEKRVKRQQQAEDTRDLIIIIFLVAIFVLDNYGVIVGIIE